MIVISCQHATKKKHGTDRKGNQRYRCCDCGKTWVDAINPLGTMRISLKDAATIIGMLVEGMSIRAVERITGMHRDTIDDLILVVGANCQRLLDEKIKGVDVKDVQIDELWSFVGCKE